MTLANPAALKVFLVKAADSSNVIFAESANYTYNTALPNNVNPFGDKGFIVQRKGGDATILRKNNAVNAGNPTLFQGTVGKKVNNQDGQVTAEAGADILTPP